MRLPSALKRPLKIRPGRLAKARLKHPVAMGALIEQLLASLGIDRSQRVIRATKCQLRAIRRPARAVDRVESHRNGKLQFLSADVPDLNFAEQPRIAAGDGER